MSAVAETSAEPQSWWRIVANVTVDMFLPVAVYYVLRAFGTTPLFAIVLTAIPMICLHLIQYLRTRVVSDLGVFVLTVFVATSVVGLFTGSAEFTLALQQCVGALVGVAFLATQFARRPLIYTVTLRFLDVVPSLQRWLGGRRWEELWKSEPRFRRSWRTTNAWVGVSQLADAAIRAILAYAAPIDSVPILGTLVGLLTAALIFALGGLYFRLAGVWTLMKKEPAPAA